MTVTLEDDLSVVPEPVAREATSHPRDRRTLRRFRRNRFAMAGALVMLVLIIIALAAPLLARDDPNKQNLLNTLQPPSGDHWLGTDTLGRDVFSRLIFGTRVSLLAGLEVLAVAAGIGVPLGLLAGYYGRFADEVLSVLSASFLSVPGLVLAMAVIASLGPGLTTAMFAVGIVIMPRFFSLARVATRDLRHELFVRASTSIGCTKRRIMFKHILPNVLPPLIVQASFVLGSAILAEASLSYLGLGVRPPTASWGGMISDAATSLDKPYLMYGPGVALTLTVLAFAAIGDGLRDAMGTGK